MTNKILFVSAVILLSLFLIVGLFFYLLLKEHRKWKQKIQVYPADRQFRTKQQFLNHFSQKGYSIKTSTFIYNQTQISLRAKDIILLPNDDLIELYERKQDEWFYTFNQWFKKLGLNYPDKETLDNLLVKHKRVSFEYIHDLLDKNI